MSYIYKITNLINGKIYIGQTNSIKKSYMGSGLWLKYAKNKYGINNFKKEIIISGDFNQILLDDLERHYIRLYNSNNKKIGYNLTPGGNGLHFHSEESKKKMSTSHKGKKLTEEAKQKLSIWAKNRIVSEETKEKLRNRKHSEETKLLISKLNSGRKFTEDQRKNMSNAKLGKTLSKEHKEKISNSLKGKQTWSKGLHLSDEHKLKISTSLKEIKNINK